VPINNPAVPKVYTFSVLAGSTFGGANLITFSPNACVSIDIMNPESQAMQCQFNGDPDAIMTIPEGTESFGFGSFVLYSIDFQNTASGASNIYGVQLVCSIIEGG